MAVATSGREPPVSWPQFPCHRLLVPRSSAPVPPAWWRTSRAATRRHARTRRARCLNGLAAESYRGSATRCCRRPRIAPAAPAARVWRTRRHSAAVRVVPATSPRLDGAGTVCRKCGARPLFAAQTSVNHVAITDPGVGGPDQAERSRRPDQHERQLEQARPSVALAIHYERRPFVRRR